MKKIVTTIASFQPEGTPIKFASNETFYREDAEFDRKHTLNRFSSCYLHRENLLLMLNQLNQLIKCVQKHRGISMSMLAGADFAADFVVLQRQLENRLSTIEAFSRKMPGIFTDKDKENLKRAWVTVRQDWQGDNLSDNFELHSHFVEQLLAMVSGLSKNLEPSLLENLGDKPSEHFSRNRVGEVQSSSGIESAPHDKPFSASRLFKQVEILRFVGKKLPELIESIAKVRGLASYAAVLGSSSGLDNRKLRFLVSATRAMSLKVIAQSERLKESLSPDMPSLNVFKTIELKHLCLLNIIEEDVLSGNTIVADAHQLFDLATDIIDVYWSVIGEGYAVVRHWHAEDLDAWCKLS